MKTIFTIITLSTVSFLTGCTELNSTYPGPGSVYDGGYYDRDPYDYRYDHRDDYYRREKYELRKERERLEKERKRLEQEREEQEDRDRYNNRPQLPPPPPPTVREHCPSGFKESSNKCTDKERKKGCRDIKMPGGLRCVDRD